MDDRRRLWLQQLPKIDELMLLLEGRGVAERAPRLLLKELCRATVERRRQGIIAGSGGKEETAPTLTGLAEEITRQIDRLHTRRLRRVVNATGVILHTNLGRAPLSPAARECLLEVGCGYSNLEFDLEKGARGLRYAHVEELLRLLTGAEDALVVNNNAAAVMLALNSLAQGGEAVVSRGELIEIGGEFRIPEVMEKGGVRLREVGTTNRTRRRDYQDAVNPETRLFMKIHTSNFKIVGFTEEVPLRDLVALGRECNLPVLNDLGSGCLIDLDRYGRQREPTVEEVVAAGTDVVTFSGDKLLGGPQAGIILGKRPLLERIKKNPLNRALRIDKLTLAALEGTLIAYLNPRRARGDLPVLKALTETREEVRVRGKKLLRKLRTSGMSGIDFSLRAGTAAAGGGSLPGEEIPTFLVSLTPRSLSSSRLEERLRGLEVPIVARIDGDEVLLDMRTLAEDEFVFIVNGLRSIF